LRCELKRAISELGTTRKRDALFSASARFAKQTKFLGAVKVKFNVFEILKFYGGERERSEIDRRALQMEFRIKFYEAAGRLNFKI